MSTKSVARPSSAKVVPMTTSAANVSDLLQLYGCGSIPFIGTENAFYERHHFGQVPWVKSRSLRASHFWLNPRTIRSKGPRPKLVGGLLRIGLAASNNVITFAVLAVVQIGFLLFNSKSNILADGERRFSASLKIVVEVTAIHAVDPPLQGTNAAGASDRFGSKASGDDLTTLWIGVSLGRLLRGNSSRKQKQS